MQRYVYRGGLYRGFFATGRIGDVLRSYGFASVRTLAVLFRTSNVHNQCAALISSTVVSDNYSRTLIPCTTVRSSVLSLNTSLVLYVLIFDPDAFYGKRRQWQEANNK